MLNVQNKLDELEYYLQHSLNTHPGRYVNLFDTVGKTIEDVFLAARNVVEHYAGMNSSRISAEMAVEIDIYKVSIMLEKLYNAGISDISNNLPIKNKIVGNCLNISKLACSILRSRQIPCRIRYAYCTYFYPEIGHEQTLVEYWDASKNKWVHGDASMNRAVLNFKGINVDIDLCDVDTRFFRSVADVWLSCRDDKDNFLKYGASMGGEHDFFGMGNVALKLVQDLACMNHVELAPWDFIGPADRYLQATGLNIEALDQLAKMMQDGDWNDLLYVSNKLPFCVVPRRVLRKSPYTGVSLTFFKDGIWKTN